MMHARSAVACAFTATEQLRDDRGVIQPSDRWIEAKADLAVGEMLVPGRESNFEEGRVMNYVYFTATLDAATWGAELASGEGPGRIYVVEPTGDFEDDPNLTDKKFPGNPTQSFRSREPLRVVGELVDWVGHSPEKLLAMRAGLQRIGTEQIED
jgi:rifampin ADP-ribosylating transferase